jgi:hypothetical protein
MANITDVSAVHVASIFRVKTARTTRHLTNFDNIHTVQTTKSRLNSEQQQKPKLTKSANIITGPRF